MSQGSWRTRSWRGSSSETGAEDLNLLVENAAWKITFVLVGFGLLLLDSLGRVERRQRGVLTRACVGLWACASIAILMLLVVNHVSFPLNIDLMEGTVLQHFRRAMSLSPVYPQPAPEFVPLAYNVLYYYFCVPFGYVVGDGLSTLRLVSILGMVGIGVIVYRVVADMSGSRWWGGVSAGLFAAAYRVMDAYLDSAHSDSWFVLSAVFGSYIIGKGRSRNWNLLGIAILVSSFWFKQHGAWFAIGGVLFLTWREGWRSSMRYWLLALCLGPGLYVLAGPELFGSHYHYFTWEVPRQWSEFGLWTLRRYLGFIVLYYLPLAAAALWLAGRSVVGGRDRIDIWTFQLPFALLTGFTGALDPGSSNNVFIAQGVWLIIVGCAGLADLARRGLAVWRFPAWAAALILSFGVFLYDPRALMVSGDAARAYGDLVATLKGMDGPVYAPSVGQLQADYAFFPAAHWVALQDMIRGPGRDERNHPVVRELLKPALEPRGKAYILANVRLEVYPWLAFLGEYYQLERDFGDRFKPLRVLPKRWDHGWPRYLYQYQPRTKER